MPRASIHRTRTATRSCGANDDPSREQDPEITFRPTAELQTGPTDDPLASDFTMKGTTKPVTVGLELSAVRVGGVDPTS